MKNIYILLLVLLFVACSNKKDRDSDMNKIKYIDDVHSFAKPEEAVMTHVDLDLDVNFEEKIISGEAGIHFDATDTAEFLTLDTKGLSIRSVWYKGGEEAEYTLGPTDEILGTPLKIKLKPGISEVIIIYENEPTAEAMQWLEPIQTAGKKSPFLYTQSQAILARTWIPLQDSPGIRFTYTARVKVPEGLMALMSAENPQEKNASGLYEFKMEQPIPAYLMALAVGDIEFKAIGERSGVYAEPSMLEMAAEEFSDTEKMIEIAETLYGPYRWGRYDIIVLPPSFPFGGMENPRLTFATPTIIAGDKSLVSLVAHELAHSWSGNLVTNATWNDFWINEGFTVYFEHRIMEELYGREYSEMLALLSQQDLKVEVNNFINEGNSDDTKLKLDLAGRNPDDGVTSIPYDKGYSFLRYIEELVGRKKFDSFLKEYFNAHAFETMTTEGFLLYMRENLFEKEKLKYPEEEIHKWVYEPGLPGSLPSIKSERFVLVEHELKSWINGAKPANLNTDSWTTHEWLHFIKSIPDTVDRSKLLQIDYAFNFTKSGNSEILDAWFLKAIKSGYTEAYPAMEKFLINTGRRKFLTPLYKEMLKYKQTNELAYEIYRKARSNYHFVAVNTIDEILLEEENNPQ